MKREKIIAYASNFASFILDSNIFQKINQIILFGSIARGDYDEESDIDIFLDTKHNIKNESEKLLSLFQNSETQKKWELKGIKNEISLKVGNLKKWDLNRDIISDGIILYGKLKQTPERIEYYLLISPSFRKFNKSKKVKIWRKLYGYKQKVGNKSYKSEGIVEKLNGKRIENGIVIKMKDKKEIIDFLNKEKINYTLSEIWSDDL